MNGDFQNPNQPDSGMQSRLLIAIVLTFLIILASQPLLQKYGPKPEKPAPAAPGVPTAPAGTAAVSAPPAAPAPAAAGKQASAESETVVENDLYRVTFSNRGAEVKSWVLKKYRDDKGQPLELVQATAAPLYGHPLSLWTYDGDLRKKLAGALYVASATGVVSAPAKVSFEYADGDLAVLKKFSFDHSYVVRVETEVRRGGQRVQAYPAWPAGFGDQATLASYASSSIAFQAGDKITRLAPKKIPGGATQLGPLHWAAAGDQYFAAAFLPEQPENAALVELHEAIKVPKNPSKPDANDLVEAPLLGVAVGGSNGLTDERLFVGPKAMDVLSSVHASLTAEEKAVLPKGGEGEYRGPVLEGLVDFGFFSIISKPLFLWLKWTHQHWVPGTNGWGWSILVLTLVINVALAPLRVSSMKSSLKMQKAQPQMKAIQDKYKKYKMNDPKRGEMQTEMNELFKREGINPVGGCLPLLLQMPFLYAFYTMLAVAVELRQAGWLWIHDLSSPDPLHLLPVFLVVTMFGTQRLTPQGGVDPVQQKMMSLLMPAFLGYISWNLSSGLNLYWTMGNLLAIIQQLWINQTKFGRELREHMAKRALKKGK